MPKSMNIINLTLKTHVFVLYPPSVSPIRSQNYLYEKHQSLVCALITPKVQHHLPNESFPVYKILPDEPEIQFQNMKLLSPS